MAAAASALGLDGSYIPHSYIELVQLERLTESFQQASQQHTLLSVFVTERLSFPPCSLEVSARWRIQQDITIVVSVHFAGD